MNKADNPKMIGSVLKTVEVLNLLGNSETGLGATESEQRSDMMPVLSIIF